MTARNLRGSYWGHSGHGPNAAERFAHIETRSISVGSSSGARELFTRFDTGHRLRRNDDGCDCVTGRYAVTVAVLSTKSPGP